MEISLDFDENVPDEVLDEHVSCLSIKNSLHSDSCVSSSPFQRESKHKNFVEASSFSFGDKPRIHPKRGQKSKGQHSESDSPKSVALKRLPGRSGLQGDIKDLLHKAMHIRSRFYYESDRQLYPKALNREWANICSQDIHFSLPNSQECNKRQVTMSDVESS